ncbi:Large ribosomal subunit protein [Trichinella pseudospiralis]
MQRSVPVYGISRLTKGPCQNSKRAELRSVHHQTTIRDGFRPDLRFRLASFHIRDVVCGILIEIKHYSAWVEMQRSKFT